MHPEKLTNRLLANLTLRLQKHETKFNANPKNLCGFLQYSNTFRVPLWIHFFSANVMFFVVKMSVSYIRELIFQENGLKNRGTKG